MISPGLVDLQVNGFAGIDFNAAEGAAPLTPEGLDTALEAMLATGVTCCLPTVITAPPDALQARLRALDRAVAAVERFRPEALVLPLGFDTYRDDPISVLKFDMAAFRRAGERVRSLGLPTVVVQEGGYMVEAIGAALDAFLEGLRA